MLKCVQKMLILVIICVLIPANIAFAENNVLEGKTFEEAVKVLDALDVIDELNVDANITRAEFTVMLCKILGYDDALYSSYTELFSDVANDHYAINSIGFLSELGIINGFENGRFYPDEPIIFEHAVKMVVCALGYDVLAVRKGGTLSSFMSVAQQIDLLDDISLKGDSVVPGGIAAQLLYNSLFVDLMGQTNYGDDFSYEVQRNVNLLSEKFNTFKLRGRITAAEYTSLFDKEGAGEGKIIIDGQKYNYAIVSPEKWLGYEVEFYVRYYDDFGGEGTVIYVKPKFEERNVITVEAENISSQTTDDTFVYYEMPDYKEKVVNIKNAYVVYNGQAATEYSDVDFKPDCGSVTLIDTDSNGIYDVVMIISYDVCIVNTVSSSKITFKYGKEDINLDPKNKKIEYKFIKNGEEIDYLEVAEWNVCSVKKTKDEKRYEFYISDAMVTGMVKQLTDDAVTIGEKEYLFGVSYQKAVNNPEITVITPQVGSDFTLYLDVFGYIAGTRKEASPMLGEGYGYLLDCKQETKALNNEMWFRILTSDIGCNVQVFKAAKKMKLNGVVLENIPDSPELFNATEKKVNKQLVIYELNDLGEIKELHTAKDKFHETIDGAPNPYYEDNYVGYTDGEFTLDYAFDRAPYRVGSNRSFHYNKFRVYTNTLVFIVPNVDNPTDEECRVTKANSYLKSDTYYSNVSLYDTTTDYDASVMVELKGSNAAFGFDTIDDGEPIAIVDNITWSLNSDGEQVPCFNGYYDGSYVSYPAFSEEVKDSGVWDDERYGMSYHGKKLQDLPKGSILQIAVNAKNEIVQMRIIFIPTSTKHVFFEKSTGDLGVHDAGGRLYTAYGTIVKRLSDGVVYNARPHWDDTTRKPSDNRELDGTDREWDRNVIANTAGVYLFDKEKDKLKKVEFNEINDGDTVFLRKSTSGINNIIIYR